MSEKPKGVLKVEGETDYVLPDGPENSVWVKVKSLAVNIIRTDEGVVVDIHREDADPDATACEEAIASAYAFFEE
jgi:hypothetical protein